METVIRAQEQAEQGFGRSILRAIVTLRWLTLVWAVAGVVISWTHLTRPAAAVGLLSLMAGFTILATIVWRSHSSMLAHPATMFAEMVVAAAALLGDGWVYDPARAQSLAWAWPAAVIVTVGVHLGARWGSAAAVLLGFASYFGDARNSLSDWGVAASSKTALYVLAAILSGYVARRLREAEVEISVARAREEVGRTLHDGVLQTLAVVQRRSTDPELAALARQQDRELRDYLFGVEAPERSLPIALRETATQIQQRHEIAVDVVAADDLPPLPPESVEALAGAVGESLTNAAKHSNATLVVVYAEPDDDSPRGVFCSVKDNGDGFDPEAATAGQGIAGSIRGRIEERGGRVEITSRSGRGTEVKLWVA